MSCWSLYMRCTFVFTTIFFVGEGCYKFSDLLHQCAKSSKAIVSVKKYQMSGYSMSDT